MTRQLKLGALQVLRLPLFMLPQLISQLVNAQVAIKRLEEFLVADEQESLEQKPAAEQGAPPDQCCTHCTHKLAWQLGGTQLTLQLAQP